MAASVASSAKSLDRPVRAIAPANEGQRAPGLVVQPVALGAPCGREGAAQPERAQEQGAGEVGRHAAHANSHLVGRNPQWE